MYHIYQRKEIKKLKTQSIVVICESIVVVLHFKGALGQAYVENFSTYQTITKSTKISK